MAWREESIVEQRFQFVSLAAAEGANIAALCRRFGISRETGHKWIARFKDGGRASLEDLPRRPRTSPDKTTDAVEAAVLGLRDRHPAWGGRKLRARLLALGHAGAPAASTITEILRRHGRLDPAQSHKHTAAQRFERERPNELWQMDFKGHVPMHMGARCHPLTVLDDCSRFSIGLFACADERDQTVRERLIAVFRRYGLPERILTDNGPPWGGGHDDGRSGHTELTVWLLRLGVRVSRGRPCHPQTQGKEERFHKTLKAELLTRQDLKDLGDAQRRFDQWRDVYNLERPHEALGLVTPATRYTPSARAYPERPPELEYGPDDRVHRTGRDGTFSHKGRKWSVGKAFASQHIGVRPSNDGGLEVRYGPYLVVRLDREGRSTRPRRTDPPLDLAALDLTPAPSAGTSSPCQ